MILLLQVTDLLLQLPVLGALVLIGHHAVGSKDYVPGKSQSEQCHHGRSQKPAAAVQMLVNHLRDFGDSFHHLM